MSQPIFPIFQPGPKPVLSMVNCYDEVTEIGTFRRSGREVAVSISLQGWWCDGLHFGEMFFQTNYTARFDTDSDGPRGAVSREVADQFVRMLGSVVPDEMASGAEMVFAPRSGPFIAAIIDYGNRKAKALADAIETYNATAGENPDDVIANLGVQPE